MLQGESVEQFMAKHALYQAGRLLKEEEHRHLSEIVL